MTYPHDDNGEVLQRMEAKGDSLTLPRNIDFTVVFREGQAAERFAAHFREQGYRVDVEDTQSGTECPWDVVVVKNMIPKHEDIGNFEATLRRLPAH